MTRATVLVTGATGQIGYSVVRACVERGIPVVAVSRTAPPSWAAALNGVRWHRHDLSVSALAVEPAVARWVHCAPLGLAARVVAAMPGLKHAVAFSSTSVLVKRDSPDRRERAVVAQLLDGEARFSGSCEERAVGWTLLRPTLIYGRGMDQNLSRLARWAGRMPFFPLAYGGRGLRQPVHAGDLAQAALTALERPESNRRSYVLAGGTTLSYRDMVGAVYRSVGRTPRFLRLPGGLLTVLIRGFAGPQVPWAMVGRMGQDLVFDDCLAREELGYDPRPFVPDAATWEPPAGKPAPGQAREGPE